MNFEDLIIDGLDTPEVKFYLTTELECTQKNLELAQHMREVGNEIYTECKHDARMHEKIWDSYLCSIALAPNRSETLALSYGNMSALLFHLCKYEDCIKNIEYALNITESNLSKVKLLCRKAKCLKELGLTQKDEALDEARVHLNKIDDENDIKQELIQLIDKTKTTLDKNKIIISSENNEDEIKTKKPKCDDEITSEHLEILSNKEVEDTFNSVAISHSNKFGRHLIATRHIKPGEIIIVAKPYILVPNFKKSQNYCNNCLRVVFSGIPCNNCAYCMYCSEKCQNEASQKYHGIECITLQFALFGNDSLNYEIQASIRAVIMAIKEFGSIINLRDKINNINSDSDLNKEDNKFNSSSFLNIFGFKNINVEPEVLSQLVKSCCRAVIGLVKYSTFFGENIKFEKIEDLVENKDIVFIASLLLNVAVIMHNNGIKVTEQGVPCKNGIDQTACVSNIYCCERGYSLNTLNQFIPHSCYPNVKSIKTNFSKTESYIDIWYALQPIPKGSPLLESYGSTFFESKLECRNGATSQLLNHSCNCIACVENWPAVLNFDGQMMSYGDIFKIVVESREHDCEKLEFLNLVSGYGLSHQKIIDELSIILQVSYKYFGQPSVEVCAAICMLHYAFDRLYGIKSNMPNNCKKFKS